MNNLEFRKFLNGYGLSYDEYEALPDEQKKELEKLFKTQQSRSDSCWRTNTGTMSKAVKEGTVKAVVLRKWPRISEEELKRLTAPKEEPKEKEV